MNNSYIKRHFLDDETFSVEVPTNLVPFTDFKDIPPTSKSKNLKIILEHIMKVGKYHQRKAKDADGKLIFLNYCLYRGKEYVISTYPNYKRQKRLDNICLADVEIV